MNSIKRLNWFYCGKGTWRQWCTVGWLLCTWFMTNNSCYRPIRTGNSFFSFRSLVTLIMSIFYAAGASMTNPSQSLGKMPQQTIVNLGQVNGGKIQTLQTCKVSIVLLIPVIYYKNISHTFFFFTKTTKRKTKQRKKTLCQRWSWISELANILFIHYLTYSFDHPFIHSITNVMTLMTMWDPTVGKIICYIYIHNRAYSRFLLWVINNTSSRCVN